MMDPDTRGKTKQAYFWVIKNPKGGVLFHFDPRRNHEVPLRLLSGMEGKLQSDGYSVYEALLNARAREGPQRSTLRLFNCWAHARRNFFDARSLPLEELSPIKLLLIPEEVLNSILPRALVLSETNYYTTLMSALSLPPPHNKIKNNNNF